MVGRTVSHYDVLRSLKLGKMSEVYLARDLTLPRQVVLKFLPEEFELDAVARRRLLQEAESAALLDHPYICKIYEIGKDQGQHYIAMEFVPGGTLRDRLREGSLGDEETLNILREIAEALCAAHEKGIVHRDLKPENIMLASDGHIKLVDFGLALQLPLAEMDSSHTTPKRPAVRAGTLAYMSPEQLMGLGVDTRSDIFSFGIIAYELLSGGHPFRKETPQATALSIINEHPASLRRVRPEISRRLSSLVDGMLEKQAHQRFGPIDAVWQRLQSFSDGDGGGRSEGRWWIGARVGFLIIALVASYYASRLIGNEVGGDPGFMSPGQPAGIQAEYLPLGDDLRQPREARITPDGQWLSLLYDVGGPAGIEIRNWREKTERVLTTESGSLISHVISPDGRQLAYLLRRGLETELHVKSLFDDAGSSSLSGVAVFSDRLIRWRGNFIYAEALQPHPSGKFEEFGLWRYDTRDGSRHPIPIEISGLGSKQSFDVNAEGQTVFSVVGTEGEADLWMADADGGNPSRITHDRWRNFDPRWVKHRGVWAVAYLSNREGQMDLWQIRPGETHPMRITYDPRQETRLDSSLRGDFLLFSTLTTRSDLWSLDLNSGHQQPLSISLLEPMHLRDPAELWSHYSPAFSPANGLLYFQRISGGPDVTSQIVVGRLQPPRVQAVEPVVEQGFTPRLSADGRWLSYFRFSDESLAQLRLRELLTGKSTLVSSRAGVSAYHPPPLPWSVSDNSRWSATGADLYFVEESQEGTSQIKRLRAGDSPMPETLVFEADEDAQLLEPAPHPDGAAMAYVRKQELDDGVLWQVFKWDPATRSSVPLLADREANHLYCLGWYRGRIRALRGFSSLDHTQRVELLEITDRGDVNLILELPKAYPQTAVQSPEGKVYLTVVQKGAPNIAEVGPEGNFRLHTSNRSSGTSFSGIRAGRDLLIFAKQSTEIRFGRLTFEGDAPIEKED